MGSHVLASTLSTIDHLQQTLTANMCPSLDRHTGLVNRLVVVTNPTRRNRSSVAALVLQTGLLLRQLCCLLAEAR